MPSSSSIQAGRRYRIITEEKAGGATYTPKILSDFVAQRIVESALWISGEKVIKILDPAIGEGELLVSLLEYLKNKKDLDVHVYGFETDRGALQLAKIRLKEKFPYVRLYLSEGNFLEYVLKNFGESHQYDLFQSHREEGFDLIIANPPYVRTQIMGAAQSQLLAKQFGLSGRVDLYYPFIIGMARVLKPKGVAGIIISNRFMTTKSGASIRQTIRERFDILHIWDLGDTKLFGAAVLPAILLVEGKGGQKVKKSKFSSIYETNAPSNRHTKNPIEALSGEGVIQVDDGRYFRVKHGRLNTNGLYDGVWRISTTEMDAWLSRVEAHTWGTFRSIGKVRVGVKTCADEVFIRSDWQNISENERPELLRPIATHHVARPFKPLNLERSRQILYTHEVVNNFRRQAVDLSMYPKAKAYLESHRTALESRKYVGEAGRKWYEIWVPQDPSAWNQIKLVFKDIARRPVFWIDKNYSIVNGDCYWLICQNPQEADLLWLAAAIGNSTFIETFYDHRFNNKLYAGRRRFITQYVEKFPLPDPQSEKGRMIIEKASEIYNCTPSDKAEDLQKDLDRLVWESFGLIAKEICR